MIHFDLPKEKSSILKVIGVGGGGSNAVNHMFSQNIDGVNFIICNTDAQAIAQSQVPNKVQLGPHLTQGLGAGANPSIGKQATEESLEEIKRILEVNTKMAFITAGMGGGTGTGGAPIIAKICKDLGVLTVGIVTTPFAYEGKKRQQQAEDGIENLKQYVDTLLVISNDKLRHQFGNLKMKDAFAKADNVLATAAKCITDVINSTGQINVDFADVCTVMRNGGVAILGSAMVEGENRAHKAIEEALNSPLLNDNDIRGAKWILININSAEGEHEFTMDEVEVIQNYLLSHAGEETDVILGLGYDNSLDKKIGITLIATGFEHKSPFYAKVNSANNVEKKQEPVKEEKIVMTLQLPGEEAKTSKPVVMMPQDRKEEQKEQVKIEAVLPPEKKTPVVDPTPMMPALVEAEPETPVRKSPLILFTNEEESHLPVEKKVEKKEEIERYELLYSQSPDLNIQPSTLSINTQETTAKETPAPKQKEVQAQTDNNILFTDENNSPATAVSGGYLAKPSNIYASHAPEQKPVQSPPAPVNDTINQPVQPSVQLGEEPSFDMQLVLKDEPTIAADEPKCEQTQPINPIPSAEDLPMVDEAEEQKRRATERVQKLRNLSFNINGADSNNEFETVPAYIRRNLELYNTVNNVENFYSNYTVKADDKNKAQISTINTFLDGKKPD
jgi:cell division protein FtsZ